MLAPSVAGEHLAGEYGSVGSARGRTRSSAGIRGTLFRTHLRVSLSGGLRAPSLGIEGSRPDTERFHRPHTTAHAQCGKQCGRLQQSNGDQRSSKMTGIEDGPEHEWRECLPGARPE